MYRSGGKESLSAVRQRLLQDRDSLAGSLSGQGEAFHKNIQRVTETVQTRSFARAESALELDGVLAARRQARVRVRQGLRALRDECLRDKKAGTGPS